VTVGLIVGIGEPLAVFTAQRTGPLRMNSAFTVNLGGAECNVAVGAARLGYRSAIIGRVGADPSGDAVRVALRGEGVDVSGLGTEAGAPTGVMFKELRAAGRVRVSYARQGSAGTFLSPSHLPGEVLADAAVVHATGVTAALGDGPREAIMEAFRSVRRAGGRTSFDVNFRARLWAGAADAAERLAPLIAQTDLLTLTRAEAAILLGLSRPEDVQEPEMLVRLHDLGPDEVVLKMDPENVTASLRTEVHHGHGAAIVALDPVGAGDAFAAGYLCAQLDGAPIARCLELAMELGRWAVSTEGDHFGLPTRAELGSLSGDDVAR